MFSRLWRFVERTGFRAAFAIVVPWQRRGLAPRGIIRYLEAMTSQRVTIDPAVCTGKPCIRGLRFPVARLLGLLAAGETREAILANYPYLEPEDIDEVFRWNAKSTGPEKQ